MKKILVSSIIFTLLSLLVILFNNSIDAKENKTAGTFKITVMQGNNLIAGATVDMYQHGDRTNRLATGTTNFNGIVLIDCSSAAYNYDFVGYKAGVGGGETNNYQCTLSTAFTLYFTKGAH